MKTEDSGTDRYTVNPPDYLASEALDPSLHPSDWQQRATYDDMHRPLTMTDAAGNTTTYAYDHHGNVLSITDALGHSTVNTYDRNTGLLLQTTDAAGGVTTYSYDPSGHPLTVKQRQADGTFVTVANNTYSVATGLLDHTEDAAHMVRHFEYDLRGRQTASYYAGADGTVVRSESDYDDEGRVTATRQRINGTIVSSTTTTYDSAGRVSQSTDTFGTITENHYDLRGNLVETRTQSKDEAGAMVWQVTRTAYDANGRAIASTDPFLVDDEGNQVTPSSDILITHTIYDALGRTTETRRLRGLQISVAEDSSHAGIYASTFDTNYVEATYELSKNQTFYNTSGQVDHTVNADSLSTFYQYDDTGRQTAVIVDTDEVAGISTGDATTSYAYDAAGRQTSITDALNHTTSSAYDALGRMTQTTYDDGTSTQTIYNAQGQKTAQVDPLNRRTDYAYGEAGRLTDVYEPAVLDADAASATYNQSIRPHWHYAYDSYGNQIQQIDPTGGTTTFTYDAQGNRTGRTLPADSDGNTANDTESWTYDDRGRMLTHIDFKGQSTKYVYDDSAGGGGRLIEEQRFIGAVNGTPDERTIYGYDALGRQVSVDEYTGATLSRHTAYTYDQATGQLITVDSPEGIIRHEYDPATGQLIRTYTDNNDTSYDYDGLGRLWHVTSTKLNGSMVNLVASYTYDVTGNLLTQTDPNGVVTTYTYDGLNRLMDEVVPDLVCRLVEAGIEQFKMDAGDIRTHGAMVASDLSKIVIRLYTQCDDEAIRKRCLDAIDKMEQFGFLGLSDELGRLDR